MSSRCDLVIKNFSFPNEFARGGIDADGVVIVSGVNDESVVWQNIETDYWKTFLKDLIQEHFKETGSNLSKMLVENYDEELKNFIQVCPKEMLDKLSNPISNKPFIKEVS